MSIESDNPFAKAASAILMRERELAERWKTSQRTLQRWRGEEYGPAWIRIGGAIRYRMSDVLDFEARQSRNGGEDEA